MNDLKYSHVLGYVMETPWAILPSKLAVILDLLAFRAAGNVLTDEEIQARIGAASRPQSRQSGAIAVLPLFGTIVQRAGMMSEMSGGTSVERFTQGFRAALADPGVGGILIEIDSPGGSVSGVPELANEILRARGQKPILAVANTLAASAAYWIGSAADELIVTPSSEVGSIGVFAAHEDLSRMLDNQGVTTTLIAAGKYKTETSPFAPLTEEARTAIQSRVDDYYSMFVQAVAKARGASVDAVRNGFGEGRVVGAREAVKLGMADGVATMDEAIGRMMRQVQQGAPSNAGALAYNATALPPHKSPGTADDLELRQRRWRLATHGA